MRKNIIVICFCAAMLIWGLGIALAQPMVGGCVTKELPQIGNGSIKAMYVSNHMMSLYPPPDSCGTPIARNQFQVGDKVMHWSYVGWCNAGDVFEYRFFNAEKVYDPVYYTIQEDGYWCIWNWWNNGIPAVVGQWGAHMFYNGVWQDASESFHVYPARVPVLIVPGIMGSLSSCLFDSSCPDSYEFNPAGPINEILGPQWVLDPIEFNWGVTSHRPTYRSLIEDFQQAGYVLNKTLFLVPYDWRQKNQTTSSGVLSDAIAQAKNATGQDVVGIACHSMGCLAVEDRVIRLGKKDMRRVAMIGPPNQGSADAYYIWEGGDFSRYDLGIRTCFIEPLIEHMKIAAGYQDLPNYKFIQAKVRSVQQLLPIDDYLLRNISGLLVPVEVETMRWRNPFIPTLDYSKLIKKIPAKRMRIFAGKGIATLKSIRVGKSSAQWADGIPRGSVYATGDGTVTLEYAKLGNISVVTKRKAEHGELPDLFRKEVVSFISGVSINLPPSNVPTKLPEKLSEKNSTSDFSSFLLVGTQNKVSGKESKILMGLTTSDNSRVGCFPFEEERLKEIEHSYYGGSKDKTGAVGIYNPLPGEYILSVFTRESEAEYLVGISWKQGAKKEVKSIRGTIMAGEVQSYKIKIGEGITISE